MSSTHLIAKSLENDRAGVRVIQMQCGETVRRAQMTCDDWEYFAEKNKKTKKTVKRQNGKTTSGYHTQKAWIIPHYEGGKKLSNVSEMSHKILAQSVTSDSTRAENSWHSWRGCRLNIHLSSGAGAGLTSLGGDERAAGMGENRPFHQRGGEGQETGESDRLEHVWNTSGSQACACVHTCDWIDIWFPPTPLFLLSIFFYFYFI